MKSNNNRKAVTVGVFIVVGILIFVVGLLTLGGQKKTFEKKIQVKAVFDDVGGLQEGNNIWYSGVKVGTVKEINFTPDSKVEVIMNIETKAQPFIKKDAKAKISSEGFIGNKIVVLSGGSPTGPARQGSPPRVGGHISRGSRRTCDPISALADRRAWGPYARAIGSRRRMRPLDVCRRRSCR